MEVNRLLGDEIVHELMIRSLPVQRTVAENRATLRAALRNEKEGEASSLPVVILSPQEEFYVCNRKLLSLENDIDNFDITNRVNENKRITSRLNHVRLRLIRVAVNNDAHLEERKKLLLTRCGQLLSNLESINENLELMESHNPEISQDGSLLNGVNEIGGHILDEQNPLLPEVILTNNTTLNNRSTRELEAARINMQRTLTALQNQVNEEIPPLIDFIEEEADVQPIGNEAVRNQSQRIQEHVNTNPIGNRPLRETVRFSTDAGLSLLGHNPTRPRSFFSDMGRGEEVHGRTSENYKDLMNSTRDITSRLRNLAFPSADDAILVHQNPEERFPYFDVSRWRIHFDGESSVTNFLEKIEELRLSRGVTKQQLLRSAPELFTKDALFWFRTQNFKSWDNLVEKLKKDFLPYDYEFDLWEEIRKRTQGSKERVMTFVVAMENLFNKLGPNKPSEEVRVKTIRRNLLPYIQSQLALEAIDSVSDLVRLSRTVEETAIRTQKFCPPPTNYKQMLEPELAYRKPPGSSAISVVSTDCGNSTRVPSSRSDPVTESSQNCSQPSTSLICWNCQKSGHRFKKCTQPRKKFCFKCGQAGVIASTCQQCPKNGHRGLC
ncbi:uncharacterized protein [Leptinotarsa decemlineata]|uniref:uncharacterized protein n=1 Tax=Leptinotarsa decemlineata TaxID=7539 RepID=UPI003D30AB32